MNSSVLTGKPLHPARHASASRLPAQKVLGRESRHVRQANLSVHCKSDQGSGGEEGLLKKVAKAAGVSLGPISLTLGDDFNEPSQKNAKAAVTTAPPPEKEKKAVLKELADKAGVSLGPISLTFGDDFDDKQRTGGPSESGESGDEVGVSGRSISSMTTEEWRALYEKDGMVDLWVEEEFNAGSRLVGGRDVHKGGVYGFQTGEGPTAGAVATHSVVIHNKFANQVVEVEVPEDRYIMWEAEDEGLVLPYACRMGCCTACAVKIKKGELFQPQALGISEELKNQGYALMCVGYPRSDLELETVDEDEIYDLQFGSAFAAQAVDKDGQNILRDDFALELADMDE